MRKLWTFSIFSIIKFGFFFNRLIIRKLEDMDTVDFDLINFGREFVYEPIGNEEEKIMISN
jgi:hypothetical protein